MKIKKYLVSILFILTSLLFCTNVQGSNEANQLRKELINRNENISIETKVTDSQMLDLLRVSRDIYSEALEFTGKGNEGDYLDNSISKVKRSVKLVDYDNNIVDFNYQITYRNNKNEENTLLSAIKGLNLNLSGNDYNKFSSIYNYITSNVYYDNEEGRSTSILNNASYTAYGALVNKKAVCQGYSLLLYRLCNDNGISCRIITGRADGSNGYEDHAWNIVKIGSVYYNVDVTWDATYKQHGHDYKYFLKSNADFTDHWRDMECTYLNFPMATTSYIIQTTKIVQQPKVEEDKETALAATKNTIASGNYKFNSYNNKNKFLAVKSNNVILSNKKAKTLTFKIIKNPNGYYIINKKTKKYLNTKGNKAVQTRKTNTSVWNIINNDDGTYKFVNRNNKTITLKSKVTVENGDSTNQKIKIIK